MEHQFTEIEHGLKIKRQNEILSLGVLLLGFFLLVFYHSAGWLIASLSFICALVWANWFEYVYHRWFDHDTIFGSFFLKKHKKHHEAPRSGCHINFGENPFWSFVVYALNSLPIVLWDVLKLHTGVSGVVLIAFVLYVVGIEEIHWRVHTNQSTPFGIGRRHHLQHHGVEEKNFNVAFPLFDWILGTRL